MFRSLWALDRRSKFWVFFVVVVFGAFVFVFDPEPKNLNILKLDNNLLSVACVRFTALVLSFLVLKRIVPKIEFDSLAMAYVFMSLFALLVSLLRTAIWLIGGV